MEVMHNLAHLALKQSAIVQCKTVIVIAYLHLIINAVSQYTCRLTSAFRYYAPKTNQDSRVNSGCNPGYGRVLCLTLRTFQESLSSLAYASSICIAKHSAPCLDR